MRASTHSVRRITVLLMAAGLWLGGCGGSTGMNGSGGATGSGGGSEGSGGTGVGGASGGWGIDMAHPVPAPISRQTPRLGAPLAGRGRGCCSSMPPSGSTIPGLP